MRRIRLIPPDTNLGILPYTWLVYLFLYAPIAILVLFSFNTTSQTAVWQGFTLEWYRNLFHDELILLSVRNSMIVGVVTTVIATVIGTLAALALGRYEFRGQGMTKNLLYLPIIIPEIVVGAAREQQAGRQRHGQCECRQDGANHGAKTSAKRGRETNSTFHRNWSPERTQVAGSQNRPLAAAASPV